MTRPSPPLPVLSVDLVEDRFRFTATVTAGSEALGRLEAARTQLRGRRDPFARMVMARAPHLAEQAGLIGTRQILLRRRPDDGVYREPIRLTIA